MSVDMEPITTEVAQLSAQYIGGKADTDEDGVELFLISDGENGVEITHEIGDHLVAVMRLLQLADEIRAYAWQLQARASQYQHGPHTGPGAF